MYGLSDLAIIAFGAWILFGVKFVYDQTRLLKAYRKYVDKKFELSPFREDYTVQNPITLIGTRLKIVHMQYPKYPAVDKLAKKVRWETIVFFALFILFIVFDSTTSF